VNLKVRRDHAYLTDHVVDNIFQWLNLLDLHAAADTRDRGPNERLRKLWRTAGADGKKLPNS
jgi:hypothetical protein